MHVPRMRGSSRERRDKSPTITGTSVLELFRKYNHPRVCQKFCHGSVHLSYSDAKGTVFLSIQFVKKAYIRDCKWNNLKNEIHIIREIMNIRMINIGKITDEYLRTGLAGYSSRLKHYVNFQTDDLPPIKKGGFLPVEQLKQKESEALLKSIGKADYVVILDEKGKSLTSVEFAGFIRKRQNASVREMVFVTGGAWGFGKAIYERANDKIALSRMTFSHQMVRLFFVEQLYRAFTILKGEGYHNE